MIVLVAPVGRGDVEGWAVVCDGCETALPNRGGATEFADEFPTREAAADALFREVQADRWVWLLGDGDRRCFCPDCAVVWTDCGANGHDFSHEPDEWQRCGCEGWIPTHVVASTGSTRRCVMERRSCWSCMYVQARVAGAAYLVEAPTLPALSELAERCERGQRSARLRQGLIDLVGRMSERADEFGADGPAERLHRLWLRLLARWDSAGFAAVMEVREKREEG